MSTQTLGSLTLALLLLLAGANLLGQLAARLRQPKVVGEILAGIVLGPSLLGLLAPGVTGQLFGTGQQDAPSVVLGFLYHLGLLLLMFVSGVSVRNVLGRENRRATAWLVGVGTTVPFFLAIALSPALPLDAVLGTAHSRPALVLVFAIATAVTSIPVITKIFFDLGILHTRFASLMLGAAVLEDIALWGVLALATALSSAGATGGLADTVSVHLATNLGFVVVAMTIAPAILRRLGRARWNVMASQTPIAWIMAVLLAYVSVAAALDVTLAFAAFLAGFGIVGGMKNTEYQRFRVPLESINQVSAAVFVPIYFAIVGYRLDFSRGFSLALLGTFLVGSSLARFGSVWLAARCAGFRGLDVLNLAVTANARGGPGIVLASVAFDAGIINAPFFTTLVVTAVVTSQVCGAWLDVVLRRGRPLLSGDPASDPDPTPNPDLAPLPRGDHALRSDLDPRRSDGSA